MKILNYEFESFLIELDVFKNTAIEKVEINEYRKDIISVNLIGDRKAFSISVIMTQIHISAYNLKPMLKEYVHSIIEQGLTVSHQYLYFIATPDQIERFRTLYGELGGRPGKNT